MPLSLSSCYRAHTSLTHTHIPSCFAEHHLFFWHMSILFTFTSSMPVPYQARNVVVLPFLNLLSMTLSSPDWRHFALFAAAFIRSKHLCYSSTVYTIYTTTCGYFLCCTALCLTLLMSCLRGRRICLYTSYTTWKGIASPWAVKGGGGFSKMPSLPQAACYYICQHEKELLLLLTDRRTHMLLDYLPLFEHGSGALTTLRGFRFFFNRRLCRSCCKLSGKRRSLQPLARFAVATCKRHAVYGQQAFGWRTLLFAGSILHFYQQT